MTEKSTEYIKSQHHAQDDAQFAHQQENPWLEEEVWAMFKDIQAAPDKAEQEAIREKLWRLAGSRNKR